MERKKIELGKVTIQNSENDIAAIILLCNLVL